MYRQVLTILMVLLFYSAIAQQEAEFPLKKLPLESWKLDGSKWQKAKNFTIFPNLNGSKKAKLESGDEILFAKDGAGLISSNVSTKDVKLRFEFALGDNSQNVIFLQGKYGIDLSNSYSNPNFTTGGVIKADGGKTLPYKNACKATGLWQKMEIVFSTAQKNFPASIEKVVLNGIVIQQNYLMASPSKDSPASDASFSISNIGGAIAIRNIEYLSFEVGNPITLSDLSYTIQETNDWDRTFEVKDTPLVNGKSKELTSEIQTNFKRYILTYSGKMNVSKADKYALTIDYMGVGNLKIDGKDVVGSKEYLYRIPQTKLIELSAGEHTFEYRYQRIWWRPALGLFVSSAEIRPYALHPVSSLPDPDPVGGIYVNPLTGKAEMIRSFVMFEGKKRTHVISVGTPQKINYSFDLNQGTLLNVWRGNFANVTEMWHERGEPQLLMSDGLTTNWDGKPPFVLDSDASKDSLDAYKELTFKGYKLDAQGIPTFNYDYRGASISQKFSASGNGLICEINSSNANNLNYKIAEGSSIMEIEKGLYLVDDKYLNLDPKVKPIVRDNKKGKEILLPLNATISYTINW
ncbi:MAG: family 16 glycoside hydrolase [Spirosomataceae bacterium]